MDIILGIAIVVGAAVAIGCFVISFSGKKTSDERTEKTASLKSMTNRVCLVCTIT
tara:strand:+ start:218 stop:382 length:165 start_codon:yes stop_codon:yes gene_type:complete